MVRSVMKIEGQL